MPGRICVAGIDIRVKLLALCAAHPREKFGLGLSFYCSLGADGVIFGFTGTKPESAVSKECMDLNRLRLLVAAPMASLFLVLSLCAFVLQQPRSVGIRIPMIRIHHKPMEMTDCGGNSVFLRMTKDGKTWMNSEELPADQLRQTVAKVMENRAERVVFVVVDSELTYSQFTGFWEKIAGATSDLHVIVVSGEVLREFKQNHDVCDFVISESEFTSSVSNSN
jgi:biopolymer transport protein ExbD